MTHTSTGSRTSWLRWSSPRVETLPLIALALAGLLIVFAAAAIFRIAARREASAVDVEEDRDAVRLRELAERKQMVIQLIQSTRLDFETGKITEADRDLTLKRLERQAVRLMKEMDELAGTEEDLARVNDELDAFIEASRGRRDDAENWSAAARMRHGGQAPAAKAT